MRKTNILLIIIAIELFIMVIIDSIRYVYIVDYTFICMSALIIALVILKRNKKFKRKCDNSKNDESNKGNSIMRLLKKIIIIWFVFSWFLSLVFWVIKLNVIPTVISYDEKSIEHITHIYEDHELLDIVDYALDISGTGYSFLDMNRIHEKYPVESLKSNNLGYSAYYRGHNQVLKIQFNRSGYMIDATRFNIYPNEHNDLIKLGESQKEIEKVLSDYDFVFKTNMLSSSLHCTVDGYIINVTYMFGKVIRINKCIF